MNYRANFLICKKFLGNNIKIFFFFFFFKAENELEQWSVIKPGHENAHFTNSKLRLPWQSGG